MLYLFRHNSTRPIIYSPVAPPVDMLLRKFTASVCPILSRIGAGGSSLHVGDLTC
jgi:hypothetical protein